MQTPQPYPSSFPHWPNRVTLSDNARSIQLYASRQEDHLPEVRLAVVAQAAAYCPNGLCRQAHESGI